MSNNERIRYWQPARFTLGSERLAGPAFSAGHAVVILNQPLTNKELLIQLCGEALFIACADGGANRLMELGLDGREKELCHPNVICGDMDSVLPEVEAHYSSLGTIIHRDIDQYSTDLTKCLRYISDSSLQIFEERWGEPLLMNQSESMLLDIAIIGGLGGRADQAFAQLQQLYAVNEDLLITCGDLYLVTPESILFLLAKGVNSIECPVGPKLLTKYVGIIPIGRPSIITTRGLEWDVTDWTTDFRTQVSTSNHIFKDVVEIETSEHVLFTVGISLE